MCWVRAEFFRFCRRIAADAGAWRRCHRTGSVEARVQCRWWWRRRRWYWWRWRWRWWRCWVGTRVRTRRPTIAAAAVAAAHEINLVLRPFLVVPACDDNRDAAVALVARPGLHQAFRWIDDRAALQPATAGTRECTTGAARRRETGECWPCSHHCRAVCRHGIDRNVAVVRYYQIVIVYRR